MWSKALRILTVVITAASALRYDPDNVNYNLNTNPDATEPKDYSGQWQNHTFNPSPQNWRHPFYVLTIDRFSDGDPTNNNANGSVFENNWMTTQFRFGGDIAGIMNSLDYLQGLGIKSIYLTGSMMLNFAWSPDGYGPLDFTLLDRHHGTIQEWRLLVDEIHRRDMYVVFDNTIATMGNLLDYGGAFQNKSVSFSFDEHDFRWKYPDRQYHDFHPSNAWNASCNVPRIWEQNGLPESQSTIDQYICKDSEFEMYGDIDSTGSYPSYINQFSRFASVQDKLREWDPIVLEKINVMSCLQITMLDIDGFRIDKAVQTTIDALAGFSDYQRRCARGVGKDNFLVVGEVVADPKLGAVYYGRGKEPEQARVNMSDAFISANATDPSQFIRPFGMSALDGAAFHYDVYGSMTRFLGLDGPWGKLGVDWVDLWHQFLQTHDLVNANTGLFDPRHMFGMTNQDVFRWPALASGIQRQLLGFFVTILEFPGVPMIMFGEEQEHYVLENLASDYVFGRAPMSSSKAWQIHGCYTLGEKVYVDMPFNRSGNGCHDPSVSLDHRDASHPVFNTLRRMLDLRAQFPVLNDGFNLTTLSTRLYNIFLPGSEGMPSPHGVWSVHRGYEASVQDVAQLSGGNPAVWLLFTNENRSISYDFNCNSSNRTSSDGALLSSFAAGTKVKNLFYPFDEYQLETSQFTLGLDGSTQPNGCISQLSFRPWEFKAFVPSDKWRAPKPSITSVSPSHDQRIESTVAYGSTETVNLTIGFSTEMDCTSVGKSLTFSSTTTSDSQISLDNSSFSCSSIDPKLKTTYVGETPTVWTFNGRLTGVPNGIHQFSVNNATSAGGEFTGSKDTFMFRVGGTDNPIVFPESANYTSNILHRDGDGSLYVTPRASGAEMFRYSTNFESSWSDWLPYKDGNTTITKQPWSGTSKQDWDGEHVVLQYWSKMTGSSHHIQHSDLATTDSKPPRRWPHAWIQGDYNEWGYDAGLETKMHQTENGEWVGNVFAEWPSKLLVNVWGMNPDGVPDKSASFGDVDEDHVLDLIPPDSLAQNTINITAAPSGAYFGYKLVANDGTYQFRLEPSGSTIIQGVVILLLCLLPPITAILGVRSFIGAFYKVKLNREGASRKRKLVSMLPNIKLFPNQHQLFRKMANKEDRAPSVTATDVTPDVSPGVMGNAGLEIIAATTADADSDIRRTVLVATMEYEIEDWNIKIKIGGLGVMSSMMTRNLGHQNLIWIVPCLGDVHYPFELATTSPPILVQILDSTYSITTHIHILRNMTFVLLDAPIFRQRTTAEPYPARMDDLESGTYYSAWNQCIAEVIRRFKPDLYHINDYHGALAPLYLLPDVVIPCCLSLHNAEFQGLWPLRNAQEMEEMSKLFNLNTSIIQKYVQFGSVFNLLHAAARYLWAHQDGYGAVGVSEKYGKRVLERYAIFWCLKSIGSLPNPDPTDVAAWTPSTKLVKAEVDVDKESQRSINRVKAQEWAGLKVDPTAELFIFVGRWSYQKGIDLIADLFAKLLTDPKIQLICIGPVIDLYGKFAALKLEKLMKTYPDRVFSKPEFTALPPFIFSGAEFALMPSRDEPFGLVAVEFGRKGALCVGSRVGGFGSVPGWWFTVESLTPTHMLSQFKSAVKGALASDQETRASMRAYSGQQRFPVAQWVERLEKLQGAAVEKSKAYSARQLIRSNRSKINLVSPLASPFLGNTPTVTRPGSRNNSEPSTPDTRSPPGTPFRPGSPMSFFSRRFSPFESVTSTRANSRAGSIHRDVLPTSNVPVTPNDTLLLHPNASSLSVATVMKTLKKSSSMQNLTPTFTDSRNKYYDDFSRRLNDEKDKVWNQNIESYIQDSEKDWYRRYHVATLKDKPEVQSRRQSTESDEVEFSDLLGVEYKAPSAMTKLLSRTIGTWNVYCYLLTLGQIMSASSVQITLLTGEIGQADTKIYALCTIYFFCSAGWWILWRKLPARWALFLPFLCFGTAFFLLGLSITADMNAKAWIYNIASGIYTAGSAAGFLFFSLNFATEGGSPSQTWAFRAWAIEGSQQLVIAFLVYWTSSLTKVSNNVNHQALSSAAVAGIAFPIAVLLWAIGIALFSGLPAYYRQQPMAIPSMHRSLATKPIVLCFWAMVVVKGFWMSTTFSRNWFFLWSSLHAPAWAVALLVVLFFIILWSAAVLVLGRLSKSHVWLIPIFAISLGAPDWCQTLWAVSGIGNSLPWAGVVGGALLSRSVWLWLGLLASLQNMGYGMMLMMTMTRTHIGFVLAMSQAIGSFTTVIARLGAPHRVVVGEVYANLAAAPGATPWFWLSLVCQLAICLAYFLVFRKSQIMKP